MKAIAATDPQYLMWVVLNKEVIDPPILTEMWVYITMQNSAKLTLLLQRQRSIKFAKQKAQGQRPWEDDPIGRATYRENTQSNGTGIEKTSLDAMAVKWFRESAKKWHPDLCKGNSEGMKAVNECYERLLRMIKEL